MKFSDQNIVLYGATLTCTNTNLLTIFFLEIKKNIIHTTLTYGIAYLCNSPDSISDSLTTGCTEYSLITAKISLYNVTQNMGYIQIKKATLIFIIAT